MDTRCWMLDKIKVQGAGAGHGAKRMAHRVSGMRKLECGMRKAKSGIRKSENRNRFTAPAVVTLWRDQARQAGLKLQGIKSDIYPYSIPHSAFQLPNSKTSVFFFSFRIPHSQFRIPELLSSVFYLSQQALSGRMVTAVDF